MSEESVTRDGHSDGELPRQLTDEAMPRRADRKGTAVQVKTMRATARTNLAARRAQDVGGLGDWETGQGMGRGPVPQSCAWDLELGTLEPSGLNPRAQTLGLEPSGSNSSAHGVGGSWYAADVVGYCRECCPVRYINL